MRAVLGSMLLVTALALPASAKETQVTLAGGVDATLNMPEGGQGDVPAVVLLHGFGSSKDEVGNMYVREAAALAERGIASIRLSFRGYGKSDGDTGASTIDGEVEDALAAADFLRAQDRVDAGRLGLLGFSLGGGVAVMAAAEHPDSFKALATWSSVGDFAGDMKEELGQATFDRARSEGVVGLDLGWRTMALKAGFFDSLEANSIPDALAKLTVPVFAVAGSEDFSSKYADSLAQVGAEGSRAWIVPGADHIYGVLGDDQSTADEVISRTADWFQQSL